MTLVGRVAAVRDWWRFISGIYQTTTASQRSDQLDRENFDDPAAAVGEREHALVIA
jgi:hypothetical protein